jgi:glycosyltransferase involved in cell wall biosynthesis
MDLISGNKAILSVITPFHRISDLEYLTYWVSEALAENIEIILVLDSITKGEKIRVVDGLPRNSTLLRIIEGEFGSAAIARNHALKIATGKWITFWDADDRPNIQNVLELIRLADNQVVLKGAFQIRSTSSQAPKIELSVQKMDTGDAISNARNPGLWRWIFQQDVIRDIEFPKIELGEDQLFLVRALSRVNSYLDSSLQVYEYNDTNQSSVSKVRYSVSNFHKTWNFALREFSITTKFPSRIHLLVFILLQFRSAARAFLLGKWSAKEKARVLIPISGGLGNQLFQCYAGVSLNGKLPEIDISLGNPRKNSKDEVDLIEALPALTARVVPAQATYLKTLAQKTFGYCTLYSTKTLRKGPYSKIKRIVIEASASLIFSMYFGGLYRTFISNGIGDTNPKPNTVRNKLILIGYFQTEAPFGDNGKTSHSEFIENYLAEKLSESRISGNPFDSRTLVVHVRLSDYLSENEIGCLAPEYFKQAILLYRTRVDKVVIFSDSESMAFNELKQVTNLTVEVFKSSKLSSVEALMAMGKASNLVISNSSFSWWAAKIASTSEGLTVVAPNPWFSKLKSPDNLLPSAWIQSHAFWRQN